MTKKTLDQLYSEHEGKVSDKWRIYLSEYDRLFTEYRNEAIRLLEIGVQNGGSLEIWSKYFSNAELLIGCDINPACGTLKFADQRISLVVGDINLDRTRAEISSYSNNYNIIIDDGSHMSGDIIASFSRYFPLLGDHGLFLVEDLHCSYWRSFDGGIVEPFSAVAFFKCLADIVNYEHWGLNQKREALLEGFQKQYNLSFDEDILSQIHSVEFVNSICVVRKAKTEENRLGLRVIAGLHEPVVPGHLLLASKRLVIPDPDAHIEFGYVKRAEEELAKCLDDIKNLTNEKNIILNRTVEITSERDALLAERSALLLSTSWKITTPLRWVKAQLLHLISLPQMLYFSVKNSGSSKAELVKAFRIYRSEGFVAAKNELHAAASKPAIKKEHR